ncbi:hypothetical protein [Mesorhizobium sp.]|uniref:hypothetical protein n=1 Tax=Mesorhizobium sp. TaxID=1871066 RepID=UPI0025F53802|nr:hypothetical protein [Mesorhizobium sp.]
MIEPGKSTLWRMRMAAADEATRIEIAQDARVQSGLIREPLPDQVAKRDDFAGIVRLIDAIMADTVILERLPK